MVDKIAMYLDFGMERFKKKMKDFQMEQRQNIKRQNATLSKKFEEIKKQKKMLGNL